MSGNHYLINSLSKVAQHRLQLLAPLVSGCIGKIRVLFLRNKEEDIIVCSSDTVPFLLRSFMSVRLLNNWV